MKKSVKILLCVTAVIVVFVIGVCAVGGYNLRSKYPFAPEKVRVHSQIGGINISFTPVEGADYYNIYRADKSELIARVGGGKELSYFDEDVKNGESYVYIIKSVRDGVECSAKRTRKYTYVDSPVLISAGNGEGRTFVKWGRVPGVDEYHVYRKVNDSKWIYLSAFDGNVTMCYDRNVSPGNKYAYTVQAIKNECISGYNKDGKSIFFVNKPTNLNVKNHKDGLYVSWSKGVGDISFRLYRKDTDNRVWQLIYEGANAFYQDNSVVNGEVYTYTVRSVGESGSFSAYNVNGVSVTALKSPVFTLFNTEDGILIEWNEFTTPTQYRLYRKANNETSWTCIKILNDKTVTSYLDTNVYAGVKYTYTIKQVKGQELGSYDVNGKSLVFAKAPDIRVSHTPYGVKITWNKVVGCSGYTVERKVGEKGQWVTVGTYNGADVMSCYDKKCSLGVKNYYRVKVNGTSLVSASDSLYGIDPDKPMVALTYDDGPYSPVTDKILNVLENNNSRATFFVVGNRVNTYKSSLLCAYNMGCEIGNHTYSHQILTSVKTDVMNSQINNTNTAVKNITGKAPVIVRAPGGATDSTVLRTIKYPFISWNIDTLDWKSRNANSVVAAVKRSVGNGSIILMHDLYESTATATQTLVPWLVNEGYQIVTVSEMMACRGIELQNGKVYYSGY